MTELAIACAVAAALAAAAVVWLLLDRGRAAGDLAGVTARAMNAEESLAQGLAQGSGREARIEALRTQNESLMVRLAGLEAEMDAAAARHSTELRHAQELAEGQVQAVELREKQLREEIALAREQMKETFRALSAETLSKSAQDFLKLAGERLGQVQQAGAAELEKRRLAVEQLVKPIAESLAKTDAKLAQIGTEWVTDRATLAEQMKAMGAAGQSLQSETAKLVRALREPQVRGRYGEIQLKKVAELAGMRPYCDFAEQESTRDTEGNLLRPDMIVRLPGGREVAVDAKANLKPYMDALELSGAGRPEEAESALKQFADGIATQAAALAKKGYWRQYDGSPEFVVMFVPGDQFVDAALAKRGDLLEVAASLRVLLASPSSLIAMLRAVHVGYQERKLAEAAIELRALGAELHGRATRVFELVEDLGGSLETTVKRYNDVVGSFRSRLEPSLRRFEETGAGSGKELPALEPVAVQPRVEGLFAGKGPEECA